MTNTENLFELVYILIDKKHVTASELAEHFGVSSRTIYRWIDCLCVAGIPIYATKGNGGGIKIDEGYSLDKTVLTEEEKLSVLASLNAIKTLTGEDDSNSPTSSAAAKLKSLSKNKTADWIEVDFANWNPLSVYVRFVFDVLKDAIINNTVVMFDYFSGSGSNSTRKLHPWKIIFRGQAWYVFGWCETRKEPRFFKLARIQNIKDTGKKSSIKVQPVQECSDNEKIKFKDECNGEFISIKLKAKSSSVYRIMDELYVQKQECIAEGQYSSLLTVQAMDSYWLYSWLLSFGTEIVVVEPEAVKEKVKKIIADMYENTTGK